MEWGNGRKGKHVCRVTAMTDDNGHEEGTSQSFHKNLHVGSYLVGGRNKRTRFSKLGCRSTEKESRKRDSRPSVN